MSNKLPKILLTEDDVNLGFVVKDNLELNGFEVVLCESAEIAIAQFSLHTFDICLLDVMLPGIDGFELARKIREINDQIPIIFITARNMKDDRIKGFLTGADDYITKPFSIEELILRIKVFLKRSSKANMASESAEWIQLGSYRFDYENLMLYMGNETKKITQMEGDLLKLFSKNEGKLLRREQILNKIWGENDYFSGRSLDVFISKLRKYLKDDPCIKIENLHGIGFKLTLKS